MSTHNICICREIRKILCGYPLLSVAVYCMGKMGKKKKISVSWFSLTQHTSPLSGRIQNFKTGSNSR